MAFYYIFDYKGSCWTITTNPHFSHNLRETYRLSKLLSNFGHKRPKRNGFDIRFGICAYGMIKQLSIELGLFYFNISKKQIVQIQLKNANSSLSKSKIIFWWGIIFWQIMTLRSYPMNLVLTYNPSIVIKVHSVYGF